MSNDVSGEEVDDVDEVEKTTEQDDSEDTTEKTDVETRLSRLERQFFSLSETVHEGLEERVERLEEENQELRDELASVRAQLRSEKGNESGTKIATAKRLARNECLRRVNGKFTRNSLSGEREVVTTSAVEVGPIVEQAKGKNVDLAYTTVKDAFDALEREWECFTHHAGDSSKGGKNRQLQLDARTVTPTLVESFRDDTDATLDEPLTNVLSNGRGGGRP